jgi:hypothetical protein
MKEYTGPEFEIEFARAWFAYVEGGKVGVDPRNHQWEFSDCQIEGWHTGDKTPAFEAMRYRWNPIPKRTVNIGYMSGGTWFRKELVAPEVEAPPMGTPIYLLDKTPEVEWEDRPWLVSWLKAGLVFLTREDAQAMADWLATCRKGGQS